MDSKIFQSLFDYAVQEMEKSFDPSHDALHLQRVIENCRRISEHHPCNLRILLAAALLHDIVNVPKNHPDRLKAAQMAADRAGKLLLEHGFSSDEIVKVQQVIKEHSFSAGLKPTSPESEVMQDADRLDAVGAIGIMRTVSCGVRMSAYYYDSNEPIARERALDDKKFTIDHFFVKLLKLAEMMNTKFGREEAFRRVEFMNQFLRQFEAEVGPIALT